MPEPHISVDVEATYDFTVEEVWPDGDAPEVVTAAAVVAVLDGSVSWQEELRRDADLIVTVSRPNPNYQGDNVLPGFAVPPRFFVDEVTLRG